MPQHAVERVVPTGHIYILFELDDIPRNTFDAKTLKPNGTFTKAWISGMHKNYLSISAHEHAEMLVVQIKTFGGYPFFQFPIHQLNDQVVPGKEIFGAEILSLRTQILEKSTSKEKFTVVENWLTHRIDTTKSPSMELLNIIDQLKAQPLSDHQSIIKNYPKTQKHLIAQFKKFAGLTPKVFHRIIRFNDILQQIQNKQKISWSQVAYLSGYADQSHFIKEFKEFSGFNPQEFIEQAFNQGEPNFFPLNPEG